VAISFVHSAFLGDSDLPGLYERFSREVYHEGASHGHFLSLSRLIHRFITLLLCALQRSISVLFLSIFIHNHYRFLTMAYTSAIILFLSLFSHSLALPVAQTQPQTTNVTFNDGVYHMTETQAPPAPPVFASPVITTEASQASQTTSIPTTASSATTTFNVPQTTGDVPITSVQYKKFSGDGSEAAGWPSITEWVSFNQM
jgi:hypothetical protein